MSRKTQKYTPNFPEMQRVFTGRKNISAKEQIKRKIDEIRAHQLWGFRQLFLNWIPARLLDGAKLKRLLAARILNLIVFRGLSLKNKNI